MTQQKKYEFTGETKMHFGVKLHRIRALVAIAAIGVAAGDLGGWIEKEENLSQTADDAWVSDDALVYGAAWVFGDAQVSDDARVFGAAWVFGDARVSDDAWVYGAARVFGDARVSDDAWVFGAAWVFGDAQVSRPCCVLIGFPHIVTVTDHHIAAGCEMHPPSVWKKRGAAIIKADGHSSKDAKAWASIINQIAAAHGCVDRVEVKEAAE